ncbi:hypothetical protein [Vibrio parahaemolyticus]|uniref:hypothetical protein n=1 Tax=Vibrio parahaemolyticus TaxID=670 RepID=UPI00111F7E82|nr:hypothetical protein [Vibrio parahaemolyticus]TOE80716.1 hypothetical protein CGJ34_23490 [Vibrio parahaemolyticus]HAS6987823.1 hypothetical protein [Vibrio parahaemolyticus]HCH3682927.1 hypothetical protein [Vibrio parahaemolyticus]HCM1502897.1 hypothetical protein [Vibrio parahaemolyticus]
MRLQKLAIIGVILTTGCSDEINYSKPHEYIRAVGFDQNYQVISENSHPYVGLGIISKSNWFKIGTGSCTKKLNSITNSKADTSMQGYNYYLASTNRLPSDKYVRHAKFECVAFNGISDACVKNLLSKAKHYATSVGFDNREIDMFVLKVALVAESKCRIETVVSASPMFHHFGFE